MATIKAYITGDTFRFKDQLKADGYSWDAAKKAWYCEYEDRPGRVVTQELAISNVRGLPGIGNRGNFVAEIVVEG
jgi:hypothetical protein